MNTRAQASSSSAAFIKRLKRHVSGRQRDYFAVVAPGLEAVCRQELVERIPDAAAINTAPGGVAFSSRLVDCLKANLHLRTATRILMRIDRFTATNQRQLSRRTAAIAWELFLAPGSRPAIQVSSQHSRLYHAEAIADAIEAGIADHGAAASHPSETSLPQTLFVRLQNDQVTLSLDSSGAPLYKRGFKSGPARAPIRETLAAGMLMIAGYDPSLPLVDPMCGSGTFSLEAAMLAKKMAPGRLRRFAFMGWPAFVANQWTYLQRAADEAVETLDRPRIFASDIDAAACGQLHQAVIDNALSDAVAVAPKDLFACRGSDYGSRPGLVVINPPYGIRIGSARQAEALFRNLCQHLAGHFNGWRVALLAPRREMCRHLPCKARLTPLAHGGLTLTLAIGDIGG